MNSRRKLIDGHLKQLEIGEMFPEDIDQLADWV